MLDQPRPTAPLAAIDVGSNTVHLVVARPTADGGDLDILADELELVRLGADVTATGLIGPERLARAVAEVGRQAALARGHGARTILGLATEGVRAARNGAELIARARAEAGVELWQVTGEQEAALTYWGASSGHGPAGRNAVVDLGGGSIELVVGAGERVEWRVSLPLGSGTVHDRLAPADPPDGVQLADATREVESAFAALEPPLPVDEAAATGGTATPLAYLAIWALAAGDRADEGAPPGARRPLPALDEPRLDALLALLQTMTAAEVAALYAVDEGRARLLAAGTVVLRAALRRLEVPRLRVSRRGIREGAILAYLRHGDGWLEAAARG